MNYCYVLYSKKLKRFYIGACQNSLTERIAKHNSNEYGLHRYTAKEDDWELFLHIACSTYSKAARIENILSQ